MKATNTLFNTADYEAGLVDAGVDRAIAKAHRISLEIVVQGLSSDFVSESSLQLMETHLKLEIATLRADMNVRFSAQDLNFAEVNRKIDRQTWTITVWLIGAVVTIQGAFFALAKFLQ